LLGVRLVEGGVGPDLVLLRCGAEAVAGFVYAAAGNLLTQTAGTKTTVYLPGEQLSIDTSTSPATLSGVRFYALPGGITAVRTGTGTAYGFELSSDQHATNTLYLNNTAQTPTWRQFDPYGNPRGNAPATGFPGSRGFLNDPVDAGTGLTSIGARWYDAATGAFASLDPVLDKASPQQLNGYTYSGADPVSSSDPTGENQIGCNGPCPPPHRDHGKPISRGTFDTGPGGGGGGTASTSHGASNNSGLGNPPTCGDPTLSGSIFCYNAAANTTNNHSSLGVWRWWAGTCASVSIGLRIALGCTGGDFNPASGNDNGGTDQGGNTPDYSDPSGLPPLTNDASAAKQALERQAAERRGVKPVTLRDGTGLSGLQAAVDGKTDFKWAIVDGPHGPELRVIPADAGGGAGNWPNTEMAHTVLSRPGESVLVAGSGQVGSSDFPTVISNWTGHYSRGSTADLLPYAEHAFNEAGIDVMAIPHDLLGP
jgi:RHS repeat-associated protein